MTPPALAGEPPAIVLIALAGADADQVDRLAAGIDADGRFSVVRRLEANDRLSDGFTIPADPSPGRVGTMLTALDHSIAIFVFPSGQAQAWVLPTKTRFARRIAGAPANQPAYVAEQIARWLSEQQASSQVAELLREPTGSRTRSQSTSTHWWVYAAVGTAVAAAGALILVDGFSQDRQRIELVNP